jgi:hypothetical protein
MVDTSMPCLNCGWYHRPDIRFDFHCPYPPRVVRRPPEPTLEEKHAAAMRAIELNIAHENAARRQADQRRDWQETRRRAEIDTMLTDVHCRQAADLAAKVDEVTAELAAARAWHRQQVKAARLDRAVEARVRQQQAEARERGEALDNTISSQEWRLRRRLADGGAR